jgi:lysophospholipase L1-like esterase
VKVAWRDLVPTLPGPKCNFIDGQAGNTPSKLSALWIGKWWHWRDYPAHSFAIDEQRLEPRIERPRLDVPPGLTRLRKKLEASLPITIVTMGDSLTDDRHWANRKVAWPALLKHLLEERYKSKVTLINPAIGGTQLRQGLAQIPRWAIETPAPDLVTVCFGGNDWDAGMRGPQFLETYRAGVDLLRNATGGASEVMILTTVPSVAHWTSRNELAQACREAAKDRTTGLADLEEAFLTSGKREPELLFVDDKVHLSAQGHQLVAETVLKVIVEQADQDLNR